MKPNLAYWAKEDWFYDKKDPSLDSDLYSDTNPTDDLNICWS